MGDSSLEEWFTFLALYSTNIGFVNYNKNIKQEENQKELSKKVDKILKILEKMEGNNGN